MVKSAISLLTSVPATFVHALDFFVSPTWPLVLLRAWNWNKRVNSRKWMSTLRAMSAHVATLHKGCQASHRDPSGGHVVVVIHVARAIPKKVNGADWFSKLTVGGRCTGDTIAGAGGPEDAG
jgi:hypothetical protein